MRRRRRERVVVLVVQAATPTPSSRLSEVKDALERSAAAGGNEQELREIRTAISILADELGGAT